MKLWLMKSEPDVFSIDDLAREKTTMWDGVRNYQARNSMRDDMRAGDLVLYYHSNADPSGIAGVARVVKEAYPDPTEDATPNPWVVVDVGFVEKFGEVIPLATLKDEKALDGMLVIKKGQRLSVQPVAKKHFAHVLKMARAETKV